MSNLEIEYLAEGKGVEPYWLIRPLDRFSGGVQYPLEIPSKRLPENFLILLPILADCTIISI